jgi:membrane protein required for colicin V production
MESIHLNWLDYVLVGLVLISTIGGAVRGLLKEVLPLVSLALGLLIAYRLGPELRPYVLDWWDNETMAYVFCFVVVFIAAWIALGIVSGLLYKLVRATAAGPLDKLFGAALGLIRGVAVAVVVVVAVLAFLPPRSPALRESALAPAFLYIGQVAMSLMPEDAREELQRRYDEMKEGSGEIRRRVRRIHPDSI